MVLVLFMITFLLFFHYFNLDNCRLAHHNALFARQKSKRVRQKVYVMIVEAVNLINSFETALFYH